MLKNKITRKLSFFVSISIILLIGIILLVQYLGVSNSYMTKAYNQQFVSGMFADISDFIANCRASQGNKDQILTALNNYSAANNCFSLLLNDDYDLEQISNNSDTPNNVIIRYIQTMFQSNQINTDYDIDSIDEERIYPNEDRIFLVKNYLRIPTRYLGIFHPFSFTDKETGVQKNLFFVAVTKEVYMDENYTLLMKNSGYLYCIIAVVVIVLSAVFSQVVTKPILKIKDTTARMMGMDFSQKCDYKARDELGELSSSINGLAAKLDATIKQLKTANDKIQNDLDKQIKLDNIRKDFIADASHDFKTPLALLRGYTEMMFDGRLPENELKSTESVMIEQIDKMDRLVLDLLDLSRLEADSYELKMEDMSVSALLEELSSKQQTLFMQKKIAISICLNSTRDIVTADRCEIERVVINLLSNAGKFTPEGGEVIIKTNDYGKDMRIAVFNSGSHIDESELDKVWNQFYRTDRSRSRNVGGSGLGLSICRRILELHGSEYGVENKESGVEFFFTLRAVK